MLGGLVGAGVALDPFLFLNCELFHPASTRILAVMVQATGTRCRPVAAASTVAASPVILWRTLFPGATFTSARRRTSQRIDPYTTLYSFAFEILDAATTLVAGLQAAGASGL